MPQMSPLMWMILFSMFALLMIVTSSKLFYSSSPLNKEEFTFSLTKKSSHWQW